MATMSRVDYLRGFKENVIMGHIIPAGTGFNYHRKVKLHPLVELADVSKSYDGSPALHPTNFAVERGKTTVLIGPSGCGKSTLLRLIIHLLEPESGVIRFDDTEITHANIGNFRHRIYGLNAASGRQRFTFPDGDYVPLSGNGGRLLLHGYSRLYAVEPRRR